MGGEIDQEGARDAKRSRTTQLLWLAVAVAVAAVTIMIVIQMLMLRIIITRR